MLIEGSFQVTAWDESIVAETPFKTTNVQAAYKVAGDMTGRARILYAMAYVSDSEASFQGVHVFDVEIDGRSGAFVVKEDGHFRAPTAQGRWVIAAGTGDFTGIAGRGEYRATHGGETHYSLEIDWPQ